MNTSINFHSDTITNPGRIAKHKSGSSLRSNQFTLTNTTNLHNFLRTRRSIRRFKPDPVPDSVIQNILTTATFAPSAHNRQPWRFVVVTDSSVKEKLADAMAVEFEHDLEQDQLPHDEIQKRITRSRERILAAPVLIILCLDMSDMDVYPDEKRSKAEYLMATQSVANAGMQLLLAAHAEGLGWRLGVQSIVCARDHSRSFGITQRHGSHKPCFLLGIQLIFLKQGKESLYKRSLFITTRNATFMSLLQMAT